MDHLDWFAPGSKDVEDEVTELARVVSSGGFVLWRSAARQPWYQDVYVNVIVADRRLSLSHVPALDDAICI